MSKQGPEREHSNSNNLPCLGKVKIVTTYRGLNEYGDAMVDFYVQFPPKYLNREMELSTAPDPNVSDRQMVLKAEENFTVMQFLDVNEDNGTGFSLRLLIKSSDTDDTKCNLINSDIMDYAAIQSPEALLNANECGEGNEHFQEENRSNNFDSTVQYTDPYIFVKEEIIEDFNAESTESFVDVHHYSESRDYYLPENGEDSSETISTTETIPDNFISTQSPSDRQPQETNYDGTYSARRDDDLQNLPDKDETNTKSRFMEEVVCTFCHTKVKKFQLHLQRHHLEEPRVKECFEAPTSKRRTMLLSKLQKEGCRAIANSTSRGLLKRNKYPQMVFCVFCQHRVPDLGEHLKKNHMGEPSVKTCFETYNLQKRAKFIAGLIKKGKSIKTYRGRKLDSTSKISKQEQFLCIFCQTVVSNFPQHIEVYHLKEPRVKECYRGRYYAALLIDLCKEGNIEASPCEYCKCFFGPKALKKHVLECTFNPSRRDTSTPVKQFPVAYDSETKVLETHVFPRMKNDDDTLIAKKDELICAFGVEYMRYNIRYENKVFHCIEHMRRLSQLLVLIHEVLNVDNLFEALRPEYFNRIIQIVKKKWGFNAETGLFWKRKSAALLGVHILELCDIAYDIAAKRRMGKKMYTALTQFRELVETKWPCELSLGEKLNFAKFKRRAKRLTKSR